MLQVIFGQHAANHCKEATFFHQPKLTPKCIVHNTNSMVSGYNTNPNLIQNKHHFWHKLDSVSMLLWHAIMETINTSVKYQKHFPETHQWKYWEIFSRWEQ